MSHIEQSSKAKEDILQIGYYIAQKEQNRAPAYRFLGLIDEKLKLLARHPNAGRLREDLDSDMRVFPAGEYLIFYSVTKNGIRVVRVLHSSRDIPHLFL